MIFRRKETIKQTYSLDGNGIEAFSAWMDIILTHYKVERQNRLRIRLSFEEAVLRFRDHFGEDVSFEAALIFSFGKVILQISLVEDAYNPLGMAEDEFYDWSGSLLTSVGIHPQYNYSSGCNYLKIVLPVQTYDYVLKVISAIGLGILVGILGRWILPDAFMADFINELYALIFDVWIRLLNLISGPVVFFMIITTVMGIGKISEVGGNSSSVLFRYSALSLFAALLAIGLSNPFAYPEALNDLSGAGGFELIRQTIYAVLPSELFTPFMESNTPQLLLMAIAAGSLLNAIGGQVYHLKRIIRQINMVGLMLTEWVSILVPAAAFILIALELMNGRYSVLAGMWKCIAMALIGAGIYIFLIFLYVSHKMHLPISVLVKKVRDPFLLVLKTGSINAALGKTEKSCINALGIEKKFTAVSLGYGLILYLPISIIGTVTFTVYVSRQFGVYGGVLWTAAAVIMSVILFVATPPVPGANLLAFTVIFATLKIPGAALTDAMVFDIVFGIFAAAANQMMLQLELVLQAYKLRVIDMNTLRKKDEGI